MQFFYHNIIARVTKSLLNVFNEIGIKRYDSEGNRIDDFIVPISFAGKDKLYQYSKLKSKDLNTLNYNVLPQMSIFINSLSKDTKRNTNKHNKIINKNDIYYFYLYNGVAYNLNYTLNIATLTLSDLFTIIEQILPMFNPDITLKIKLFKDDVDNSNFNNKLFNIPVKLEDINLDIPQEINQNDIRILRAEINLKCEIMLYPIIKEIKKIKEYIINIEDFEGNIDEVIDEKVNN